MGARGGVGHGRGVGQPGSRERTGASTPARSSRSRRSYWQRKDRSLIGREGHRRDRRYRPLPDRLAARAPGVSAGPHERFHRSPVAELTSAMATSRCRGVWSLGAADGPVSDRRNRSRSRSLWPSGRPLTPRLVRHARASDGWLVLTHGAIVCPGADDRRDCGSASCAPAWRSTAQDRRSRVSSARGERGRSRRSPLRRFLAGRCRSWRGASAPAGIGSAAAGCPRAAARQREHGGAGAELRAGGHRPQPRCDVAPGGRRWPTRRVRASVQRSRRTTGRPAASRALRATVRAPSYAEFGIRSTIPTRWLCRLDRAWCVCRAFRWCRCRHNVCAGAAL